jgi:hypothetical protein
MKAERAYVKRILSQLAQRLENYVAPTYHVAKKWRTDRNVNWT